MVPIEDELISYCVLVQMLETQKHTWSNRLALNPDTEDTDRITIVLDSIELQIEKTQEKIKYIGDFLSRPLSEK